MKKLRKLLRVPKRACKKCFNSIKKYFLDKKEDDSARRQLVQALLSLGPPRRPSLKGSKSEDNVRAGLFLYDEYLYGLRDGKMHTRTVAARWALHETAKTIGNEDNYQRALKIAYTPIVKADKVKVAPKPTTPFWVWVGRGLMLLIILGGLFLLFSSTRKITINNPQPVPSDPTPVCTTWMMVPMTVDPKNNSWIEDGVAEIAIANRLSFI